MATQNNKEDMICNKRLQELANHAFYKGYSTYSDFLNLNEQSLFYGLLSELPSVEYSFWGGIDAAERKMLCFSCEEIRKENFPLSTVQIAPSHDKFAEKLSHRDYLGAILNLGIERRKIGDILIQEKIAYIFVEETLTDYLCNSLTKVRHTNVCCNKVTNSFSYTQQFQEINGTVSSVRLDSLIALAFRESRSSMVSLISGGKVFVNGRQITSNSYILKNEDIISVRGKGKFLYKEEHGITKKGKVKVILKKYV
ncbi:MAG: RNA-binding protein [Clostridiales bacterium]|nr:RNA-binding protein [Clostridiales bacterium]